MIVERHVPSVNILRVSGYKMEQGAGLCEAHEDAHENHTSEDEHLIKSLSKGPL